MIRPKIALLTPRFGIADRGAEGFTYQLAKRLSSDFDVTVFARERTKNDKTISAFENIKELKVTKVRCITSENALLHFFSNLDPNLTRILDKYFLNPISFEMLSFSAAALPRLLRDHYDIIFPHNGVWGALICRLIRAIKKTPFVYISHGGIEPMIAKQKPDVYFVFTEIIESWYKKNFPDLKVVFTPTPTDISRFTPEGPRRQLSLERPIFISVAACIPVKRLDLAIKAISKLREGSLLVIGQGHLRDKIEALARKLLGKSKFLIKEVPYDQVPQYLRAADVFTLAAKGEPGSVTPVEAMACGLPVVVNDEEHSRFVVGTAGILVDTQDINSYAKALEKASRLNFGDLPRKQAEKFSWDRMIKIYRRELIKLVHD